MRFGPNVVEHAPFSIPMIGNTATGYVIGLTPEAPPCATACSPRTCPKQRSPR